MSCVITLIFYFLNFFHFASDQQPRVNLFLRTFGSVWKHFWFSWLEGCYWHLVEGKDAAKYLTMHRTAPTTTNYLAQNINSARVEKPCVMHLWNIIKNENMGFIDSLQLCDINRNLYINLSANFVLSFLLLFVLCPVVFTHFLKSNFKNLNFVSQLSFCNKV